MTDEAITRTDIDIETEVEEETPEGEALTKEDIAWIKARRQQNDASEPNENAIKSVKVMKIETEMEPELETEPEPKTKPWRRLKKPAKKRRARVLHLMK